MVDRYMVDRYLYEHMRTHGGQSNPVRNLEINALTIALSNF